jgi:hypothetical protein
VEKEKHATENKVSCFYQWQSNHQTIINWKHSLTEMEFKSHCGCRKN